MLNVYAQPRQNSPKRFLFFYFILFFPHTLHLKLSHCNVEVKCDYQLCLEAKPQYKSTFPIVLEIKLACVESRSSKNIV